MAIAYKQRCVRCKKNYVLVTSRQEYPVCYDCQKAELSGKIDDPVMKKLFDIDEDLYQHNSFLRNIKISYIRYGRLTEKQITEFKKAVEKVKESLNK